MIDNHSEIIEDVSPLWTAGAVNHFNIVRLLIVQSQSNINHLTKNHSTTFRVACYNNKLEMIKYLINHGVNPYQTKFDNYTNLMLCAGCQYLIIIQHLINELQLNINEQDENVLLIYLLK